MNHIQVPHLQQELCHQHNASYVEAADESISGLAISTEGLLPLNGLRHPLTQDASGWFIWCGQAFSEKDDFFQPTHTRHLYEKYPLIAPLLGLPPGYRFLQAGEYV